MSVCFLIYICIDEQHSVVFKSAIEIQLDWIDMVTKRKNAGIVLLPTFWYYLALDYSGPALIPISEWNSQLLTSQAPHPRLYSVMSWNWFHTPKHWWGTNLICVAVFINTFLISFLLHVWKYDGYVLIHLTIHSCCHDTPSGIPQLWTSVVWYVSWYSLTGGMWLDRTLMEWLSWPLPVSVINKITF